MAKRVLIADDSDSVRKLIQSVVEQQQGIEVCALTDNGMEAIAKATDLQPDLLILDVQMPGLNGIEVAGIVRDRLPNAKIILFTIYGDAVKSIAASVGANVVLAKADGLGGLARTVQSLLTAE
jgi:CheY-like chemotaxis protein